MSYLELMGVGPSGWGPAMLAAAGVTLAVALCAFLIGGIVGMGARRVAMATQA